MEDASKDVLFTIALNLDLPSLLRWCESNSRIHRSVCQNDDLWRSKLLKDFPNEYSDFHIFNVNKSLRETYVFLYQLSYIKKLLNSNESLYDIFLKKYIDLSYIRLKKIPAFDLPNLQILNLDNNKLTKIPTFDLPNLQILNLSNNQLTKVPAFDLPNLQILNLSNNQLREVPAFNLPNLQRLYLDRNKLTEVPVFNLPSLQVLFLSDNHLTNIPAFNLPNLLELYLSNNRLTKVTKNQLKQKYGNRISL